MANRIDDDVLDAIARVWHRGRGEEPPPKPSSGAQVGRRSRSKPGVRASAWPGTRPTCADFDRAAKGAGVRVLRTAVQAPLMNSICERFLGSVRRECLDHVIILCERDLERVLRKYCFRSFNVVRPYQGLGQRVPSAQKLKARTDHASVIAVPMFGKAS